MTASTYHVFDSEGTEVASKSKKASAIAAADSLALETRGATFEVKTNAGTVVHTALRKTQGKHAAPWTRVDSSEKIELEVPAGFTAAYTRSRIPALVCRADDKSGWLVVTPEGNFEAKDTIEAREITNRLGKAATEARLAAKEQLKAEKAQKRADAKAAKEAEKAAAAEAPAEVDAA